MCTTYTLYTDKDIRKQAAKAGLSTCSEKNTFSNKNITLYLVCNFYGEEDSTVETCMFWDLPTLSYFEQICGILCPFEPLVFVCAHLHFFWELLF